MSFIFTIQKSFGRLLLYKESKNLTLEFYPLIDGLEGGKDHPQYCKLQVPSSELGEFLVTARCFLEGIESSDFLYSAKSQNGEETMLKLYRDKNKNMDECWLRLVTGKSEDQRKRIKLTKRDLVTLTSVLESIIFD